jgi:hypothetical protein
MRRSSRVMYDSVLRSVSRCTSSELACKQQIAFHGIYCFVKQGVYEQARGPVGQGWSRAVLPCRPRNYTFTGLIFMVFISIYPRNINRVYCPLEV